MSLIKKLTNKIKENKNENYMDFFLNDQIKNLKLSIKNLSTTRRQDQKKDRDKIVALILKQLDEIKNLYKGFLRDLNNLNQRENMSVNTIETMNLMTEKKKSLRKDFERIYINFKKTAMGLEDVPMKMILKRMREAFNFNTQQMEIQHGFRYYDSTTMSIRYI